MEPVTTTAVATAAWIILRPYLERLAGKAADKVGEAVPSKVVSLWKAVRAKMGSKPAADEAVNDAVDRPQDEDSQATARVQLRKLLDEDPHFLKVIQEHIDSADSQSTYNAQLTGSGAIAQGTGSQAVGAGGIAIGGNMTGNLPPTNAPKDSKGG